MTGTLLGPTGTIGNDRVGDVTPAFSGCRAGGFAATTSCTARSVGWWETSYFHPVASGFLSASANPVCTISVPSIGGCTVRVLPAGGAGTSIANAAYDNSAGTLTVATTGQALTAQWSSCATLFGTASGSATATFTNSSGADLVFRVTSAFVPFVSVYWNSTGSAAGTAFTASGPASKLAMAGVAAGVTCTASSASGLVYGPTGVAGLNKTSDVSTTFSACRAGGFTATVSCAANALAWWVASYDAPTVPGFVTAGANPICTVTVPSISGCILRVIPTGGSGSRVLTADYDNSGTLTIAATGQAITSQWSSCGTLFGTASGSATAALTNLSGTALVFTLTAGIPTITI
jgi:hypothetical protein